MTAVDSITESRSKTPAAVISTAVTLEMPLPSSVISTAETLSAIDSISELNRPAIAPLRLPAAGHRESSSSESEIPATPTYSFGLKEQQKVQGEAHQKKVPKRRNKLVKKPYSRKNLHTMQGRLAELYPNKKVDATGFCALCICPFNKTDNTNKAIHHPPRTTATQHHLDCKIVRSLSKQTLTGQIQCNECDHTEEEHPTFMLEHVYRDHPEKVVTCLFCDTPHLLSVLDKHIIYDHLGKELPFEVTAGLNGSGPTTVYGIHEFFKVVRDQTHRSDNTLPNINSFLKLLVPGNKLRHLCVFQAIVHNQANKPEKEEKK